MNRRELTRGTVTGLLFPIALFWIYFTFFSDLGVDRAFKIAFENNMISKVFSLLGLTNLLFFFLFLNKNRLDAAKGVFLATLIYVALMIVYKIYY